MDEQGNPPQAQGLARDYWSQSRRPLAGLLFTGPLLAIYEVGLIGLGPSAVRNGADDWMRKTLDVLGFKAYFLLPVLTLGILLGWQHLSRQPWHVPRRALYGMAGECLALALGLWLFWILFQFLLQAITPAISLNIGVYLGTISSYLGAGVYEELLFRLIMMNLTIGLLAWMRAGLRASVIGGVVLTSLVFSAAHYVPGSGDAFRWVTFLFRFLAGVYFALLFRYRGFGIAAGTHAFYDVLVGLSMIAAGGR